MVKCKNCKHLKNDSSIEKKICFLIGEIGNPDEEISCACYRPATNADRIRSMADEELAKFLESVTCETHGWCDDCTSMRGEYCHGLNDESNSLVQERLKWLKSEAECEK